uniref:Uncharacterized protein n=1 Tax=Phlebotomus papatasi TaxID=29031 RepID=A0A1B0D1Y2_PHLPP
MFSLKISSLYLAFLLLTTIISCSGRTVIMFEIPHNRAFAQYSRSDVYRRGGRTEVIQRNGYGSGATTIMQTNSRNPYQEPSTVIIT